MWTDTQSNEVLYISDRTLPDSVFSKSFSLGRHPGKAPWRCQLSLHYLLSSSWSSAYGTPYTGSKDGVDFDMFQDLGWPAGHHSG